MIDGTYLSTEPVLPSYVSFFCRRRGLKEFAMAFVIWKFENCSKFGIRENFFSSSASNYKVLYEIYPSVIIFAKSGNHRKRKLLKKFRCSEL